LYKVFLRWIGLTAEDRIRRYAISLSGRGLSIQWDMRDMRMGLYDDIS